MRVFRLSHFVRCTALALAFVAAITLTFIAAGLVRAQDAAPTTSPDTPGATSQNAVAQQPVTQEDVNAVARELWCPLCNNVRLDTCELKACAQMKDVIKDKLGQGETLQTIRDYFVEYYGPQVLGAPPLSGFNWLAWILPFAVLVGGGAFLWSRARRISRPGPETTEGEEPGDTDPETAAYAARLDEELRQHE